MASAMETNDSDIPSESESDDSTGSEVQDDEFSTANYSDAENHKNVLKTIYKYSKRGKYCDVTLVAGKDAKRIAVHRVFLLANTRYFDGLLDDNVNGANHSVVRIDGVGGYTLKALVEFCYRGKISMNESNVDDILEAATILKFPRIINLCERYYMSNFSAYNYFNLFLLADEYNLVQLKAMAAFEAIKTFQMVARDEKFPKLKIESLKWLLCSDGIYIYSEEEVFNALIRWIEFDVEGRKLHFADLVQFVRVQQIKQTFLMNTIFGYCHKYDQVNAFLKLKDVYENKDAEQLPRLCFSQQPVLYTSFAQEIKRFDPARKQWHTVYGTDADDETPEISFQVDDHIYMLANGFRAVCRFSLRTCCMQYIKRLISQFPVSAVAVLDNNIYCIDILETILMFDRYDISSGEWTRMKPLDTLYYVQSGYLMEACAGFVFAICHNYLDGMGMFTLCYNPATNEWHRKADLSIGHDLRNVKLFVRNGMLSVIHRLKLSLRIYEYDLAADGWRSKASFDLDWPIEFKDVSVYKGILYIYAEEGKLSQKIHAIYTLTYENDAVQRLYDAPGGESVFFVKPYDLSQ